MALAELEDAEVTADRVERFVRRHLGWTRGAGRHRTRLRPALEMTVDQLPLPASNSQEYVGYDRVDGEHRFAAPRRQRELRARLCRIRARALSVRASRSCSRRFEAPRAADRPRPSAASCERRVAALDASRGLPETTPGVARGARLDAARAELRGRLRRVSAREAIAASLTAEERREILRGMVLTRAADNRLKQFFTSGEVTLRRRRRSRARDSARSGRRRSTPPASGCGAARRTATADGGWQRRRRRPAHPRPRRRAGDAPGAGDRAHGAQRADGQGRPADGRQGPAHRRLRAGASCRPPRR